MTTDEQLFIGLYNQEKQSLADLYDRYSQLLWKISYRTVADDAICERILREVFQDIWANPDKFNNGRKLSSLLIECCLSRIDSLVIQKIS
jgi:DNA-directed RNA polymerase specialized sigma24 family protein